MDEQTKKDIEALDEMHLEEQQTQDAQQSQEQLDTHKAEKEEAKAIIDKVTDEDDADLNLISIFAGDILKSRFIMNQILFVVFCVILTILYTGNRYSAQQDTLLIDSLRTHLQEVKYNVLTQSSVLMNMTRQSSVESALKQTKDSLLTAPLSHPYLIKTKE